MTLIIDTGTVATPVRNLIPDFFQDWHPDADDSELMRRYCFHIVGEITGPKKLATARKHMLANWQFLRMALEACPDHADEVFTAYAERAQAFD